MAFMLATMMHEAEWRAGRRAGVGGTGERLAKGSSEQGGLLAGPGALRHLGAETTNLWVKPLFLQQGLGLTGVWETQAVRDTAKAVTALTDRSSSRSGPGWGGGERPGHLTEARATGTPRGHEQGPWSEGLVTAWEGQARQAGENEHECKTASGRGMV